MSTLSLRASHMPAMPGLAWLLSSLNMLFEVFAESQQRARVEHERWPFVDW